MKLTRIRLVSLGFAMVGVVHGIACGKSPSAPTAPAQTQSSTPSAPAAPSLSSPVLRSPIGNTLTDTRKPSLTVGNASASGNVGTVTYQFEVSEVSSFPADSRSSSVSGIAQGDGSTTWQPPSELISGFVYFWHARATNGSLTTEWSKAETFRTP